MIIYKITNIINNKVYIGLTTVSLEVRWKGHLQASKTIKRHLYNSMRYYGIENFKIEKIDSTDDFKKLGELERYYIRLYKSNDPNFGYNVTAGGESNQLDGNPRAKLSLDEVIQIREIYSMCELKCKDCWEMYKNKISFSAFQKVWEGTTWTSILPEVYTEDTINFHKTQSALNSQENGNSIYTNEEVMIIRNYYISHTLEETFNTYGSKSKSIKGFRNVIDKSYSDLPIYSKKEKSWVLNGKKIDINNYNPVSTISESGE